MDARTAFRHLVAGALVVGIGTASSSLMSTQQVGASAPAKATAAIGTSGAAGELYGVDAMPDGDAWAVGFSGTNAGSDTKALTLYWNGSGWRSAPTPRIPNAELRGVAATSLTNGWAVGSSGDPSNPQTLILHRKGTRWQQMPSTTGALYGVSAVSSLDAWAVGSTNSGNTLILRWNGKTWQRMPPTPGTLSGVAAVSPKNAWAVGSTNSGDSLILHWNGNTWQQVPSPNPGSTEGLSSFFSDVTVSGGMTWAVGNGNNCGCGPGNSLIARWNGNAWAQVPAPTFGGGVNLSSVASVSSGRSWAVGLSGSGDGPRTGVILQRTGATWARARYPQLGDGDSALEGVAAISRSNGWAVGWESAAGHPGASPAGVPRIVILRWNGTTWKSEFSLVNSAKTPVGGVRASTTTTLAPTTTTTVPPTTTLPPATTTTGPLLGSAAWGQALGSYAGISGFGEVAPANISLGGVASSPHVGSIAWSNWGAPQATGQGQAIDGTGQSGPVSSWPVEPATVVAFDLGSCDGGPPAYQEVTWYFPQDGQTFDSNTATNACTGE